MRKSQKRQIKKTPYQKPSKKAEKIELTAFATT